MAGNFSLNDFGNAWGSAIGNTSASTAIELCYLWFVSRSRGCGGNGSVIVDLAADAHLLHVVLEPLSAIQTGDICAFT